MAKSVTNFGQTIWNRDKKENGPWEEIESCEIETICSFLQQLLDKSEVIFDLSGYRQPSETFIFIIGGYLQLTGQKSFELWERLNMSWGSSKKDSNVKS